MSVEGKRTRNGSHPLRAVSGFTTKGYIHALVDSTSNSNSNSDSRVPLVQISDDSHITHDSFRLYTDQREASHLRNRNINGAGQVDNTDVMDQFSQWSSYKRSSSPHNTGEPPIRHVSQRRTDFTSKDELSKFSKNHNFIFHKGFLKRQRSIRRESRQAKVRSRFRNKKELTSVLDYVELEQMDIRDVLPCHSVNMHAVRNITSSTPAVTAVPRLRNQIYTINASTRPLRSRNHSIRRKLPKSHPVPRPITPTTTTAQNPTPPTKSTYRKGVRRSNTSPGVLYHPRTRGVKNPNSQARQQQQLLLKLWKEYLMLVVAQRTQLRLSFLSSPGSMSNQSSPRSSNASDLDISLLSTPTRLFHTAGHTKSDPIIIPDDRDDNIHSNRAF